MKPGKWTCGPHPGPPVVTIPFSLPENSPVRLEIYNILGQRVITLVDQQMRAGYHKRMWKGVNESGVELSSGVYFVKMRAGKFQAQRKIVLLK
ncbi:MAG: T9SS type A sorting domain-containing protein [bacterium]